MPRRSRLHRRPVPRSSRCRWDLRARGRRERRGVELVDVPASGRHINRHSRPARSACLFCEGRVAARRRVLPGSRYDPVTAKDGRSPPDASAFSHVARRNAGRVTFWVPASAGRLLSAQSGVHCARKSLACDRRDDAAASACSRGPSCLGAIHCRGTGCPTEPGRDLRAPIAASWQRSLEAGVQESTRSWTLPHLCWLILTRSRRDGRFIHCPQWFR